MAKVTGIKVSTNVKPKKKKSSTEKVFEKAEVQASKKLAADTDKAKKADASLVVTAGGHSATKERTGRVTQQDLAESRAYRNKSSITETARVKGLKQTGYYDAKPAVVGGTKKMVRISKKNVKKSGASSQAKKAAKKLY